MIIPMLLSLIGPFLVLSAVEHFLPRLKTSAGFKGRLGISFFLLGPAISHFANTEAFVAMLPPFVPWRSEIVYVTGICEFLGAIGIWIPQLSKLTGLLLIVMLIGFLPANIFAAFARVDYGGSTFGPAYLLIRIPFQFFIVWWIYWSTEQNWRKGKS
jgi:uncharacterized membrane protein